MVTFCPKGEGSLGLSGHGRITGIESTFARANAVSMLLILFFRPLATLSPRRRIDHHETREPGLGNSRRTRRPSTLSVETEFW